jgi:protein required for attachment to host cells
MSNSIDLTNNPWIVVADGTGAKLYSSTVKNGDVSLQEVRDVEPQDEVHSGPSGVRPPEQTDQQTTEATFANQLAKSLYSSAHSGRFDALVVIADPQTLGQLREIFHKKVNEIIIAEVPKTLTNLSQHDLEDALSKMAA